jgi:tripartite motif-containing protein 71
VLLEWGGNGTGPGEFIGPSSGGPDALAVDVVGHVYATDRGNYRVQKFDANGNFLGAFGSIGQGPGQFISRPYGLAADMAGNMFASDLTGTVQKFDGSSGRSIAKWERTGGVERRAILPN